MHGGGEVGGVIKFRAEHVHALLQVDAYRLGESMWGSWVPV